MLDVYRLLPEGTPIQLINNRFYMSPAPLFHHFVIVKNIFIRLNEHAVANNLGIIAFAPVDVYLENTNALQPDIFFISDKNTEIIKQDGIHGAPDLIVEVLSPSNKNDDIVKKKEVYEFFGVKEYFIVEPSDKTGITYYLKETGFVEQKKTKGKLASKILKKTFVF
jgi:Uma2 family endonuclease